MNRWNILNWLEREVLARDGACVYCGVDFSVASENRGTRPSWEHVVNDATIVTSENIARCCMSCNASKGAKDLQAWLESNYCKQRSISRESISQVVKAALSRRGG